MASPIPEFTDNARRALDRAFVRALRDELTATQVFTSEKGNSVPLGVETIEWKDVGSAEDVAISMDFPVPNADALGTITTSTLEIPLFSKHRKYDRRDWDAVQRSGMDTVVEEEFARAMAEELNEFLYFGTQGSDGTGGTQLPGPNTSILNDANRLTVDNSGTTNWTLAEDVITDLAEAIRELRDNSMQPPFKLLMSTADSDIFFQFDSNTNFQTDERMPAVIQRPVLFDDDISANSAFLIDARRQNFDYFFLDEGGDLGLPTQEEWTEQGGAVLWKRWWHGVAPRVRHPENCVEITFDRS